jgi:2,3-bisphosphoglycerate-dependent phosphoglycerate mutase
MDAPRRPPAAWPAELWLVRHGESAGNVERDAAEAANRPIIDIAERDVDVPLSPLGARQARALGRWFAEMPPESRPTVVLTSPYLRALETTRQLATAAGLELAGRAYVIDERLREKEFGLLNRLTRNGIAAKYPEQAALRAHVGKFYYRPPSGESWCDVILRLRGVMSQIERQYAGERVLIVAHQVIVLCFRYLIERLTEAQILAIDREGDVANCSVTSYERVRSDDGAEDLRLSRYNFVAPLEAAGAPVTTEPDVPAAPR